MIDFNDNEIQIKELAFITNIRNSFQFCRNRLFKIGSNSYVLMKLEEIEKSFNELLMFKTEYKLKINDFNSNQELSNISENEDLKDQLLSKIKDLINFYAEKIKDLKNVENSNEFLTEEKYIESHNLDKWTDDLQDMFDDFYTTVLSEHRITNLMICNLLGISREDYHDQFRNYEGHYSEVKEESIKDIFIKIMGLNVLTDTMRKEIEKYNNQLGKRNYEFVTKISHIQDKLISIYNDCVKFLY